MARLDVASPTVDHRLVRELKGREDARFSDVDAYLSAWNELLDALGS